VTISCTTDKEELSDNDAFSCMTGYKISCQFFPRILLNIIRKFFIRNLTGYAFFKAVCSVGGGRGRFLKQVKKVKNRCVDNNSEKISKIILLLQENRFSEFSFDHCLRK
jgi:hypothetical protein